MKKTVAQVCNQRLDLVRKFAPSLVVARASLMPFDDVIECEEAGPQNGEDVPPYFAVMIRDSEFVRAEVTADKVRIEILDENHDVLDEWDTTLRGLWDYMRQVQRPASSFKRR